MRTCKVQPPVPQAVKEQISAAGKEWKLYECKLVTPMYGGGVMAGEVDKAMPIRASAIRGQLRFWWRIANGPFASSAEMFRRETAIWGGIGGKEPTASQVEARIVAPPIGQNQLIPSSAKHGPEVIYAFGAASINGATNWLSAGYKFCLQLRYPPAIQSEVQAALRYWASFGGLGARTRRGFGAFELIDPESKIGPVPPTEVEKLGGKLVLRDAKDAEIAWKNAIGLLRNFRQGPGFARKDGSSRPGRSFWPEPDQIRRFTKKYLPNHKPVHGAENVFPRAAFGLPITFKFYSPAPENYAVELMPDSAGDRMASPLILRPYRDERGWHAAALLLPCWAQALQQKLKFKSHPDFKPKSWAEAPEHERIAKLIGPMHVNGEVRAPDPLTAFMHFFAEGRK